MVLKKDEPMVYGAKNVWNAMKKSIPVARCTV